MKTLYAGNLPFSITENEISDLFGQYGNVISVELIMDRMTGRPRGFGFVQMDDEDADKAVENLNDQMFAGRKLQVNEARPKEERPFRRSGDREDGFGGGERRPFRRRFDDRDNGGFRGGDRKPFRRRFDDREGGFNGGERRPFRRRFDDRDNGGFNGGERRPFRRFDDREGGFNGGERRPFRRRFDDRDNGGFNGGRKPFRRRFEDFDGQRPDEPGFNPFTPSDFGE